MKWIECGSFPSDFGFGRRSFELPCPGDVPYGIQHTGVRRFGADLQSGNRPRDRCTSPPKDKEVLRASLGFEEWVNAMRAAIVFFKKNRKKIVEEIAALSALGQGLPRAIPPKPISLDLVKSVCGLLASNLDMRDPVQVCLILPFVLELTKLELTILELTILELTIFCQRQHRLISSSW